MSREHVGIELKVCVVALDALEYTLVNRGDYPNLKQPEYGLVEINVSTHGLRTPVIWASFITGEKPEKHGVIDEAEWDKPWAKLLRKISNKFGLYRIPGKGKILEKSSLARRKIYSEEHFRSRDIPTIFDYVEKTVVISVPSYNEWTDSLKARGKLGAIGNPLREKELEKYVWEMFYRKKEKTLELLESDWELFMVHFFIVDIIQHMWWYKADYLRNLYNEMDKTARQIKMKLPKNTFLLIVSDHGSLKGYHTPYAFYSCSEPLDLKNPKITDFASIILQKLGVPSKKETDEIKEKLRSLGYF